LTLHSALAFDSSNNFTLYNDIDISGYFRGGNSNWMPVYYEEYELNNTGEWFFRFNLDEATIGYGHLFDSNQNGGSYANLTNKDISFNGVSIPAETIITPDGSIIQPSDDFFSNNRHGSDVIIYSSLGNDYVNLSGSQQDIQVKWSPGNDTFIFDLNEDHYRSPEFTAKGQYRDFVQSLGVSDPDGLTFDNSKGPALEVFFRLW
jgi:hypothetical protein